MIIVTGGAGFIGSAVIWSLNQRGREDIVVVDHLGTGEKWKNLAGLRFADYFEKEDFLRLVLAGRKPTNTAPIDAIVHLGACSATTEQDASYLIENNFGYSKHLALYALRHGARFVYASSAATYGDGSQGFSDAEESLSALRPLNMYGYSKQLFDLWAKRQGLMNKIAGLKYFNVFGPNEYHKGDMRSLVAKAYEQVVSTGKLELFKSHRERFADGEQMRDFIYVKDAAALTLYFVDRQDKNGIFNVGSGKAQTWNSLARAIFGALGKPERIDYVEMPEPIREKYQYYTCADTKKLAALGLTDCLFTLETAVEDYILNYLSQSKRLGE